MLSLIGFVTIFSIVALLIRGRMMPLIAMTLIPVIAALVAGFGFAEITDFFKTGLSSVMNIVVMFIFAIIFFGIMQDAGLFNPLINRIIAITRGNIVTICVGSVVIAAIAHLDGSGASTFLITIPALLPVYKRLRMSPYLLLLLIGGSASVMNMLPWAGPLGRTATVLETDVTQFWLPLIPIQIIGLVLMLGLAVMLGIREKRRIALQDDTDGSGALNTEEPDIVPTENSKTPLIIPNLILALGVLGLLVFGLLPAGLAFMIGTSIALLINLPNAKDQAESLKRHAPGALSMASIILAAGVFLGVLTGTGMLKAIAGEIVHVMPDFIGPYIHLIVGVLGLPFDLLLSTDAYYFALLPIVDQIGVTYGIPSTSTAYAMVIGNIVGTFVSPFSPALWLALGLANAEMGKHIRYAFGWMWLIGLILLAIAVMMGLIVV